MWCWTDKAVAWSGTSWTPDCVCISGGRRARDPGEHPPRMCQGRIIIERYGDSWIGGAAYLQHAHEQALLEATRLAGLASSFVDFAFVVRRAGVLDVALYSPLEECLAGLTAGHAIMVARCHIAADQAEATHLVAHRTAACIGAGVLGTAAAAVRTAALVAVAIVAERDVVQIAGQGCGRAAELTLWRYGWRGLHAAVAVAGIVVGGRCLGAGTATRIADPTSR